jgi:dCTP diphosphatase
MGELEDIKQKLREFAVERDWDQFHSPKNLVMALSGETGELNDVFQWLSEEESRSSKLSMTNREKAKEEIADIFLYLIRLADKLDIDLAEAGHQKLKTNAEKYPVNLAKGNATKYNRRDE